MKIVVCITFCLIICLGHGFTQPRNLKSLSPMLTMRQEKEERMFFDYIEVNKRPWEDVNLEKTCSLNPQYRTLDGYCNNKSDLEKGMAGMPFEIISQPLRSAASNAGLPLARRISNNVCNEDGETENDRNMSEMMTFFGQFLDHTSSFIDASSVYGFTRKTLSEIREYWNGRLKLPNNLLPYDDKGMFKAGDDRANENPNLTAFHLLFAREHNTVAAEVKAAYPSYNDQEIFDLARHIVAAELQAVVYYGYIPALTGSLLETYKGYDSTKSASISNRFSTVAFRFGHTMLRRKITGIKNGIMKSEQLRDMFFRPAKFVEFTLEGLLRGMMSIRSSEIDHGVTGEVRNFLFPKMETKEQLDLVSLNIQRGRDHGVPLCNDLRASVSLPRFTSFEQMAQNENVARNLRLVYDGRIQDVDSWVCGISEPHQKGSSLGPLFHRIIRQEFARLRDTDYFYFERPNYFTNDQINKLKVVQRLVGPKSDLVELLKVIIFRNTNLKEDEIQRNPFFARTQKEPSSPSPSPSTSPKPSTPNNPPSSSEGIYVNVGGYAINDLYVQNEQKYLWGNAEISNLQSPPISGTYALLSQNFPNIQIGDQLSISLRTHRWSKQRFGYVIPVPKGEYSCFLHFAETSPYYFSSGKRKFHIIVNGFKRWGFDVYGSVGSYATYTVPFENFYIHDTLKVEIEPVEGDGMLSAITLLPIYDDSPPSSLLMNIGSKEHVNMRYHPELGTPFGNTFISAPKPPPQISGTEYYDVMVQTHRWGKGTWGIKNIPFPDNVVDCALFFAETSPFYFEKGKRVFHATVKGRKVSNIDVFAEFGANTLGTIYFRDMGSLDGPMDILIEPVKGDGFVSGIGCIYFAPTPSK